jgi:hypothetical protein
MRRRLSVIVGCGAALVLAAWCGSGRMPVIMPVRDRMPAPIRSRVARKIVEGARREVERGVRYDASYALLSYPGGDVPADRGACTDVVIRALRNAGFDLQRLIHEDMSAHFRFYPHRYGLAATDPSIDHRRCGNHVVYFRRHGLDLPCLATQASARYWQPGDLVYWGSQDSPFHCGVCSDRLDAAGLPYVIHNMSQAREEDCLSFTEIAGHFRFPRQSAMASSR